MSAKDDLVKGKKVLIVDDEPDVLDTLGELLYMCKVVKAGTLRRQSGNWKPSLLIWQSWTS